MRRLVAGVLHLARRVVGGPGVEAALVPRVPLVLVRLRLLLLLVRLVAPLRVERLALLAALRVELVLQVLAAGELVLELHHVERIALDDLGVHLLRGAVRVRLVGEVDEAEPAAAPSVVPRTLR